ncbi:MAG: aspartate kinase [Clostridia bacterium BRH_c25]|nr:MAG: aspartate kinase [Clostridia bacterium BRH_c25]
MRIIVQKFGGTSVSTKERRSLAADKIESCISRGCFPVVVVSAIGRNGDPYATDTLIEFSHSSGTNAQPRELDLLMSCGEIISCVVLSNTLKARGLNSAVLTGGQAGIITDDNFGDASVLRVDSTSILNYIRNGIIPIITGFQGITEKGDITTLGRGGGDVTGAILGEALEAEAVEVYTDVDGVMTADPVLVPNARVMDILLYDDVYWMAEYGAKVIHKKAVQIAMRSNIPLIIKNTMTDSPGTLITGSKPSTEPFTYVQKPVTAIACTGNKALVKIVPDIDNNSIQADGDLFSMLYEQRIDISMINLYPWAKSFAIDSKHTDTVMKILEGKPVHFEFLRDCSILTVIGSGMKGLPGVMAKISHALAASNIPLLHTSDSHTTISCLVEGKYAKQAVTALHEEFEL